MVYRNTPRLLAFILAVCLPIMACAQSPGNDADRKARIVSNLKHSVAQLSEVAISVTSITPGEGRFDKGVINLAGQQNVNFLVSKDDTELYLLATDAIDVSRSEADLAELRAEEERAEGKAALARGAMLLQASAGLPERGNPNAPITIIEFSDFQCPYCARATDTVDKVMEEFGDEVRLVYMHLPLESLHPWAMGAAVNASCAAAQSPAAFWTLHDYYFANQKAIDVSSLKSKSQSALAGSGVDIDAWSTCVDTNAERSSVVEHQKLGQSLGLTGTPAFYINGRMINGAQPIEDFREMIALAKKDMAE